MLAARPEVARVMCPMLPGSPGHEVWARDFTGGCGLFSFVFRGGSAGARNAFIDALELFGIGYSWGGFESLALPITPRQYRSIMPCPTGGAPAIRLSIGLEEVEDLSADIISALDQAR